MLLLFAVVADDQLPRAVEISLLDQTGTPTEGSAGTVEPADEFGKRVISAGLSIPDLLVAPVSVSGGGRTIERSPRTLVLLERRVERGRLEEVGRAQLGAEYVLLVREGQAGAVREMLDAAARPNWAMRTPQELRGVPEGWRAFLDVQLLAIPATKRPDLAALIPVGWTRLSVSGGLQLPGRRAFLARRPPEVAASVLEVKSVRAVLSAEGAEPDDGVSLGEVDEVAVWDLRGYGLAPGVHRVTLVDEDDQALDSERIALFTPDLPLERVVTAAFGHRLGSPIAALTAETADDPDCRGAWMVVEPERQHPDNVEVPSSLGPALEEDDERHPPQAATVSSGVQAAGCIETGAHLMRPVEGAVKRSKEKEAPWRCAHCGMERFFPTSLRRIPSRRGSVLEAARLEAPPLQSPRSDAGHQDLVEALCTVRAGSWGDFARLVAQVDDRAWAKREIGRLYSAVGLIDIECSPHSLEPVSWQVAPPVLVDLGDSGAYLAGWRSTRLLDEIEGLVALDGGSLTVETDPEGFPMPKIQGLPSTSLRDVAGLLDRADEWGGLRYCAEPGLNLSRLLPRLSQLRSALPAAVLPLDGLERYDESTGGWRPRAGRVQGGYRCTRGAWRWWHARSDSDVRVADSRLAKWLAALDSNEAMLAYREEDRTLLVHAGCPLPGLYERAAVLCSGHPPAQLDRHLLSYPDLPPEVASNLARALRE